MEPTYHKEQTIIHQFDSFCKKLLRNEKNNYINQINTRIKREILFSEMIQKQSNEICITDKYPSDTNIFKVHDFEVNIENDLLANALSSLSSSSRDIVLLSYFLELSDTEIARMLNIVRRTVQYRRTSSLEKLKRYMEGFQK